MLNIKNLLLNNIRKILKKIKFNYKYIKVGSSKNKKFGDYQICGLINIENYCKKNNTNYIDIINKIKLKINNFKFVKYIEIINNNFINIFLKKKWIEKELEKILISKNLNINNTNIKNVVVDYSSPNMSKEMHVGHLRSMILGDVFYRISKFLGHNIYKINHIGDWGVNFGMIIANIKENKINNSKELSLKKLESIYINSKKKYNINERFKIKSNYYFNKLINKDYECIKIWKNIVKITLKNNKKIYNLLDIKLNDNDIIEESFYQKFLPFIIKDLKKKNISVKKNKSVIIPLKNLKNKKGKEMCVVIRNKYKSYLYPIIEIASIRYRCKYLFADRLVYYIDSRQKDHLLQTLKISKIANYINNKTKFEHHNFGMILDKNKQPFKTRDKNTIKLKNLINKYFKETKIFIEKKNKNINESEKKKLIKILAIGTLKYYDLSKNRLTNYTIDWNKIFSLKENTLIHIQYSFIRIRSIFKKINHNVEKIKYIKNTKFILNNKEEIEISILIIKFEEIIRDVYINGTPNILCLYIYKISILFSKYYSKYNILEINNNNSLLNLILIISKIIKKSLYFLGIKIPKSM